MTSSVSNHWASGVHWMPKVPHIPILRKLRQHPSTRATISEHRAIPLLLHIGLNKSGTTTMQRHVWPHWQSVAYLGRRYPANRKSRKHLRIVRRVHGENFVADSTNRHFDRQIELEKHEGDVAAIYSNEALLRPSNIRRTLHRFRSLSPCPVLIVSVRKPSDIVPSWLWHRGYRTETLPEWSYADIHFSRGCIWPIPHTQCPCSKPQGAEPLYGRYWDLSALTKGLDDLGLQGLIFDLSLLTSAAGAADFGRATSSLLQSHVPPPPTIQSRENVNTSWEYESFVLHVQEYFRNELEQLDEAYVRVMRGGLLRMIGDRR